MIVVIVHFLRFVLPMTRRDGFFWIQTTCGRSQMMFVLSQTFARQRRVSHFFLSSMIHLLMLESSPDLQALRKEDLFVISSEKVQQSRPMAIMTFAMMQMEQQMLQVMS
jgi:hypothetical protein